MSDHKLVIESARSNLERMNPEQRAAFLKDQQDRALPKNFVPTWVDLTGKYIVITGANQGVGYEAAKKLAKIGQPHIILACRSQEKGNEAAQKIREETKNNHVESMVLDVSSLKSVEQFVKEYREKKYGLDILINNAGIMATPYQFSVDNVELQFATNHLGHFLLTKRLLDLIPAGGRIVNLSSNAHYRFGGFENMEKLITVEEKDYQPWVQYGLTKAMNVMFTFELQRQLDQAGKQITCAAIHPGLVRTNLQVNIGLDVDQFSEASGIIAYTPERGADNTVYTAACPGIPHGKYWDNTELRQPHADTLKPELQTLLWNISERLIAEKLPHSQ